MTWPRRLAFVAIEDCNMLSIVGIIEPFRVANHLGGQELFTWSVASVDGSAVTASNGMRLDVDGDLEACNDADLTFIAASWFPERHAQSDLMNWIRSKAASGARLGGVDTGAIILAEAGVLNGMRATCNYDVLDAFAARFPKVTVTDEMYLLDERHVTCSAGTAPIDLSLELVRTALGDALADRVSAHLFHERLGGGARSQLGTVKGELPIDDPRLATAVRLIEASIDQPVTVNELALAADTTPRHLQRLFRQAFGENPSQYAMRVRLERARQYLLHTELRVIDVAFACGFASPEHFARRYRQQFGTSPRGDRQRHRPRPLATVITQRDLPQAPDTEV